MDPSKAVSNYPQSVPLFVRRKTRHTRVIVLFSVRPLTGRGEGTYGTASLSLGLRRIYPQSNNPTHTRHGPVRHTFALAGPENNKHSPNTNLCWGRRLCGRKLCRQIDVADAHDSRRGASIDRCAKITSHPHPAIAARWVPTNK